MSIPKAEAKRIYDNYMSGLAGVAKYQEYCKQIVLKKGYVTLNPILGHKAYWWDKDACLAALDLYNSKDTVALTKLNNKLHFIKVKFNGSEDWSPVHLDHIMDFTDISLVKKKISDWKKRSVNFRIQGTGAMCFKNALIHFWDYLCKNNLVFIVLICLSIHDECDSEAPEEIADEVASNLLLCMKKGAAPFCTEVNLEADLSLDENNKLPNYWIH